MIPWAYTNLLPQLSEYLGVVHRHSLPHLIYGTRASVKFEVFRDSWDQASWTGADQNTGTAAKVAKVVTGRKAPAQVGRSRDLLRLDLCRSVENLGLWSP